LRLLVDTHCWLWFLLSPEKLNAASREALSDGEHSIYFSTACAWEIVIKEALGKLELPLPPSKYIPARLSQLGHEQLPILQEHVLELEKLPAHHRDPFDRILLAQARIEELLLVTADRTFALYDQPLLWAGPGTLPSTLTDDPTTSSPSS
jgi:PIN domain nuclease of toxin-antitoxin system